MTPFLVYLIIIFLHSSDDLGESLDHYVANLSVSTYVLRTSKREGLIKARLLGAEKACGSVLVFLDAHVEVVRGWLPPLLSEIVQDRRRVVMPMIGDIDHDTFEFIPNQNYDLRDGMDWKLSHSWIGPDHQWKKRVENMDSFPSPAMIGNWQQIKHRYEIYYYIHSGPERAKSKKSASDVRNYARFERKSVY